MLVLAIDTCGDEGSIALARLSDPGVDRIGEAFLAGKSYSAQLMPAIRDVLTTAGLSLPEMECIVVVRGPGSFTGVRVGLSTAKGLAQAVEIPVLGVSRLQVLAHKAGADVALLDAGRGELYFGRAGAVRQEELLTAEQVQERLGGLSAACCEDKVAAVFPQASRVAPPTAADALRYARSRMLARDFDDLAAMDAHYLRRSEAEMVADRKAAGAR